VASQDAQFASAEAYDRFVGRYSGQLAAELTAFAAVRRGMRALDVGCGPGALTSELATQLGAENVAAADPSEPFVEACRRRVPGAEVVVGGAEALPFPDGGFDAALSQLVVNFMADAEAGVREMARVTRRGGIVASCVWDYGGEMTLLRAFWDSAHEVEPERAAAADEARVMRFGGDGDLVDLWRLVGLDAIRFTGLVVSTAYTSFEDLWWPLPRGIGPAGAFTASLDAQGQQALAADFRHRLGVGDEPFELTARAWAVAGIVGD
jgi:SAM-dependent methyltransferase